MYNVGDKVVYPMHGAGVIDSIEEKEILGEKQSYYILKMPGEVKVMVPISTAEQHGIRNVIDKNEAERVINVLEQDETEMEKNWNKRYRDNMDKMKGVDLHVQCRRQNSIPNAWSRDNRFNRRKRYFRGKTIILYIKNAK